MRRHERTHRGRSSVSAACTTSATTPESATRPLALAGGVGFALPRVNGYLDDALDACDGILLGGGRDIDPRRYGQHPTEHLGTTDPLRDEFELELVERALDRGLPILGMCRGIQILNVALGGTLVQDVAVKPEWADHPSDRGWKAWKEVERLRSRESRRCRRTLAT